MRGARGTTLLGLGLVVVAGMFDAAPLYVPGIALMLLGVGQRGVGARCLAGVARRAHDQRVARHRG